MANSGRDGSQQTLADGCDYYCCCDLCERDGKQREAVGYCSDCQDYLCEECFNTHLRPTPTRHHVLLDQHQMPKDQQQNRGSDTCTEVCTDHPHKTLEYFCSDHDMLGCTVCMTLNHRNCQGVDHIPDIASDILSNVEYIDMQKKITSLTQKTTTAIQTSHDQAKCSNSYHTNALEAFKQFKRDISKAIDRIEKTIMKEADKLKKEDEKKMESLGDKYKNVQRDIQAISSKFTSSQNRRQFCQMFIAMKRARLDIDAIEARLGDPGHDIEVRNYRLATGREVQLLLDSPETMVKLEIVKENLSDSNLTQVATPDRLSQQVNKETTISTTLPSLYKTTSKQGAAGLVPYLKAPATWTAGLIPYLKAPATWAAGLIPYLKAPATWAAVLVLLLSLLAVHYTRDVIMTHVQHNRDARNTRAQHAMDIKVRTWDDSGRPWITGCVVLPGDKLVLVDRANSKIKLIDLTQNNLVSELKLPGDIKAIAQVSSKEVAVTSSSEQTIYFVNVDDILMLDRKVKVKGDCVGITNINDNLVVSYVEPVKLEIISMKGQVLQTVVTEDKGRQLFTYPGYVAVSKDQQTIYISDWDRDTVTSVALTGQVLATYKDYKLSGPRGLTVDTAGTVYVCGWYSNKILQLTADLTEVQVLLQQSDGVYPESVCYCETTDRLYIGMLNKDDFVVKVYQLK